LVDLVTIEHLMQQIAQHGGKHDGHLLAGRLPADKKPLRPGVAISAR
jgi:hypothetical protein